MNKYKKKEMLKTLALLIRANDSIIENRTKSTAEDITDALLQCQETAITLGTCLESLGEQRLIPILEDYCENLYQIGIGLSDKNLCKKLSKKIRRQLIQISNEITLDLPEDKKEIVFFPYQSSMWDSMESVWRAAIKDEGSNTYVVPIPYFDREPDGSLGQMHEEGGSYPDDVPVTSWETYQVEQHRPDIGIIHNPYDQYNRVTSVHPMFYAKELKKYVDKLVYIPYFVATNDVVDPHFCVLPGTLHSDLVIVQSEKVRKTYMEELHKFEKENNCSNAFGNIKKKVIALGSPKYDKLTWSDNSDHKIPESWKPVLYRTDGSKKKTILYNTSIQNFLTQRETMLTKIEHVLHIFERCQEETALWWRPHPLLSATLQSMLPELWEGYHKIVRRYREDGWGIFDDSTKLHRALAVSDAYYGDGGSLLELYQKTGKPIMLQNVEITEGE